MKPLASNLKNLALGLLAAGVVLVDSVSYFWSMASDLLFVGALVLASKIPVSKN